MKPGWALAGLAACVTGMPALAQSDATERADVTALVDVTELEQRVLSGELSPEAAISAYCEGDSRDKTQDAFCACPEEALRLLEQRLKTHRMDAS
ncbi:MAG: hypothetical protein COA37_12430 [Hoeflea sp.]|uniref:hypothetical protein n=1 Tax=Hoeflea sp. TaxID=1940281 RepID=UPI000C10E4DE|nr:hypothetical protein [Hoeflea sp.]PHR22081.1 MAG: hypothetical protein COA37_12430 [Hoeflea sp.]